MSDPERATGPRRHVWWIAAATAAVLILAAGGSWLAFGHDDHRTTSTTADAAMSARAQQVMPFDLSRTTHTFTQTPQGGVEKVVVNVPSDTRDRDLIRTHLQTEAENFRRGNYSDPAKIHGMDMPGVNALEQGAARISVVYAPTSGGAQITYTSTEATLISALHAWFDRQAADHSAPGMGG